MSHALRWVGITVVLGGMLLAGTLGAEGQEVVVVGDSPLGNGNVARGDPGKPIEDIFVNPINMPCPVAGLEHISAANIACAMSAGGGSGPIEIPTGDNGPIWSK